MVRAPDNLEIRRLGVKVRYALALSDLAEPQQYFYASPAPSALFRSDRPSVEALWDALNLISDIIATGEPTSPSFGQPWRLACLANLPEKRLEAADQAKQILARDQCPDRHRVGIGAGAAR